MTQKNTRHYYIPYFSLLSQVLSHPIKIAIGVSGGPDSMFLASVALAYYTSRGRSHDLIHIIHVNHRQRKESAQEQAFVIDAFPSCYRYWNTEKLKPDQSETSLRRIRHDIFTTVLEQENIDTLLLGHNLTDRIETSIFNMVRGATNGGRQGMKQIQKHKTHLVLRPLLSRSKQHILDMCDTYHIPYVIDASNFHADNPRNILRNTIIPEICSLHPGGAKQREKSRSSLYSINTSTPGGQPHKHTSPLVVGWHELSTPKHWSRATWKTLPLDTLRIDHLWQLIAGKKQLPSSEIYAIFQDITSHKTDHHTRSGWELFVVGNSLHCISSSARKFWEEVQLSSKLITRSGVLQFDGNIYTMLPERIGYTLRYPQPGDVYKKKTLRKTLLNRKIPIFLRSITPVVAEGNQIITILS